MDSYSCLGNALAHIYIYMEQMQLKTQLKQNEFYQKEDKMLCFY
jgi:hypothetical protein